MNRWQKISLSSCGAVAAFSLYFLLSRGPVSAPGFGIQTAIDWGQTLLSALGVGGLTAATLIPKVSEWIRFALAKFGWGGVATDGLIDAGQITLYVGALKSAGSEAEKEGIRAAGRACCLAMSDRLFGKAGA